MGRVTRHIAGDELSCAEFPATARPTDAELTTAREALLRAESLMSEDPLLAGESFALADLYLAPQVTNCRKRLQTCWRDSPRSAHGWSSSVSVRSFS
jgi:glutathione S-transferase